MDHLEFVLVLRDLDPATIRQELPGSVEFPCAWMEVSYPGVEGLELEAGDERHKCCDGGEEAECRREEYHGFW
jgi:hypothetical protein